MNATIVTIAVVVGAVALHYGAARSRWPWLAAILPVAFVVGAGVLAARGAMTSVHDWLMAALSLVLLLTVAGAGRDHRAKRAAARRSAQGSVQAVDPSAPDAADPRR